MNKTKLLEIAQALDLGSIDDKKARTLLLGLLGVSESKSPTLNDVQRYYYQKHHFDENGKVKKRYIKKNDDIIHELILGFCKNFYSR